jgi:hypothetical protein
MDGHGRNTSETSIQLPSTHVLCLLYGKASQGLWQEKGVANKNKIATTMAPGQIISVDQMQSTVPGMVGQIKGTPKSKVSLRYHAC